MSRTLARVATRHGSQPNDVVIVTTDVHNAWNEVIGLGHTWPYEMAEGNVSLATSP